MKPFCVNAHRKQTVLDFKLVTLVESSRSCFVTSLAIADAFGREHFNVLASIKGLIERGRLGALDFKGTSYKDVQNKKRPMLELTERGFLIAMPFIGGDKAEEGQVRLVDEFIASRTWVAARVDVADYYKIMQETLKATRALDGLTTEPHHYQNESRAINQALTGVWGSRDRNTLTTLELSDLQQLERRNANWIEDGDDLASRRKKMARLAKTLDLNLEHVMAHFETLELS